MNVVVVFVIWSFSCYNCFTAYVHHPFSCAQCRKVYVQLPCSISQSKTGKQARHLYTRLFAYYYHRNTPEMASMYFNSQYCVNYRFDLKLLVYRIQTWHNRRKSLDSLVDFKLYIFVYFLVSADAAAAIAKCNGCSTYCSSSGSSFFLYLFTGALLLRTCTFLCSIRLCSIHWIMFKHDKLILSAHTHSAVAIVNF